MAKIVICGVPQHPDTKRGDAESIYDDGVELTGPGYESKVILQVPTHTAQELGLLATYLEPEYVETISSKTGRIKLEVEDINKTTKFLIKNRPKYRANFKALLNSDNTLVQEHQTYLLSNTKEDCQLYLQSLGIACVYDQLIELIIE